MQNNFRDDLKLTYAETTNLSNLNRDGKEDIEFSFQLPSRRGR